MSLQVWLPLTKDLRQQGLSNVTVTNNGATFNSAGKLGGCYQTDGSHKIAISSFPWMSMKPDYNFSLFLWVKGTTTGWLIAAGGWELLLRPTFIRIGLSGNGQYPAQLTDTFDSNTWYHLGFTWDGAAGKLKLYLNGSNVATSNVPTTANFDVANPINLTYDGPRYLNDFRIYDHCLSLMEVKELSKGLVLHYPLNRDGWGQENLITHSGNFISIDGWTNNQSATLSTENNELKVVINQTTSTPGIKSTNTIDLPAGTYTGSLLIKVENGNKNYINYPFYLANAGGTTAYGGAATKREVRGDYIYEEATFTTTSAINGVIVYILTSRAANGETWHLKWLKLEKGSVATPWCPNSSDALATIMGLNGTTEYDCSGFCNNGTRTGTFSWTSDTPKYSVSTQFSGTQYIRIPFPCSAISEAVSVAVWGYESNWNTSSAERLIGAATNSSGWCIGDYGSENTLFAFYANGGYNGVTGFKQLSAGWHHFVITFDGLHLNYYVDGQLFNSKTFSTKQVATGNYNIEIGRHYGGGYNFKGRMSDVRIYATALSADDVKSLYQNSAYIDSSGNVYGAVHSEV